MREPVSEKSPRNILSDCLVESDPAVRAAGRRTRVVSVGVSLLMQAVVLTLLVIVPLLAAGKLPAMKWDTPTPIFRRGDPSAPPDMGNPHAGSGHGISTRPPVGPIRPPTKIPTGVAMVDETGGDAPQIGERGVPWGDTRIGVPLADDAIRHAPPPPTATTTQTKPVIVSKGVMEARLIHRVQPCYPPLAKQMRLGGSVQLRAIIATDGTVQALEVLSGHPVLLQCAIDAVKQWRYKPTLLNDQPVEVETFITVNFVLSR